MDAPTDAIWLDLEPVHYECLSGPLPPLVRASMESRMVWLPAIGAFILMGHLWWGDVLRVGR